MLTFEVESHNKVRWIFKLRYLWIWIGLLVGLVAVILMMAFSPAAPKLRNAVIATAAVIAIGSSAWLIIATPNTVTGYLERLPDSGSVHIERYRLPFVKPRVETLDLDTVESFTLDAMTYERTSGDLYTLARLWAVVGEELVLLSDWTSPNDADGLGQALAKAARKPYNGMDDLAADHGPQ